MKVVICKGLPASGKSTFAKELVSKGGWVRVNKDDLRYLLHGGKWSRLNEKIVERVRDSIITEALESGQSVVVDDTNLAERHITRIKQIVCDFQNDYTNWKQYKEGMTDSDRLPKVQVEVKFFDVDVEECVKRDLKRPVSVGEKVIRGMYNQFIRKIESPIPVLEDGKIVVLSDLDGTLALFGDKNPYDRDFINDKLNATVAYALQRLNLPVILMSGRSAKHRGQTEAWLDRYGIKYQSLYMRLEGDQRKDSVVKRELYETYVNGKYNVFCVFDDRDQVVKLWRNLGLKCFQVAEGSF